MSKPRFSKSISEIKNRLMEIYTHRSVDNDFFDDVYHTHLFEETLKRGVNEALNDNSETVTVNVHTLKEVLDHVEYHRAFSSVKIDNYRRLIDDLNYELDKMDKAKSRFSPPFFHK